MLGIIYTAVKLASRRLHSVRRNINQATEFSLLHSVWQHLAACLCGVLSLLIHLYTAFLHEQDVGAFSRGVALSVQWPSRVSPATTVQVRAKCHNE